MEVALLTAPTTSIGLETDNPAHTTAKALREGAVQLTSLSTLLSYHRYFFLFNDVLIISKQKGPGSFKLKEKLKLEHVWVASSNTTDSFLVGWPVNNFLVHFRTRQERDDWFNLFNLHVSRNLRPLATTLPMEINVRGRKQVIRRRLENGKKAGELVVETIEELGLVGNTIYELRFVLDDNVGKVMQGPECVYAVVMAEIEKAGHRLSESQRAALETCALVHPRLVLSDLNSAKTASPLHIVNSLRKKVLSRTDSRGIFGRELEGSTPPQPILTIIDYLRIHGLEVEGLFRKSPKQSTFKELKAELDRGLVPNFHRYNIHVVASLLKDYLRSIPGRILLNGNYELWMREVVDEPILEKKLDACRSLLTLLPSSHSILLANLLKLLTRIASTPESKMTASSLSVCLAPSFLESRDVMEDGRKIPALVEFLILHAAEVVPGVTRDGLFASCDVNANFLHAPQTSTAASYADEEEEVGCFDENDEDEEEEEDEEMLGDMKTEEPPLKPQVHIKTTIVEAIYKEPLKPSSSLRIEEIKEEKVVEVVKKREKSEEKERPASVVVPMPFKTIVKPPSPKLEPKRVESPKEDVLEIVKRLEAQRLLEEKRKAEEAERRRIEAEKKREAEEERERERKRAEQEALEQEKRLQLAFEVRAFFDKPALLVHKESLEEKIDLAERIARLRHVAVPYEKPVEEEVPEDPPGRAMDEEELTDDEDAVPALRPMTRRDFARSPRHMPRYTPHLQRSASFAMPSAAALQRTASLRAHKTEITAQQAESVREFEDRQRKWDNVLTRRDSKAERCVGLGQLEINWSVRQLKARFQDAGGEAPQIRTDYLNPCLDRLIN